MKIIVLFTLIATMLTTDYTSEVEAHRKQRDQEFRDADTSPLPTKKERKHFTGLKYFPIDEQYKVTAKYTPIAKEDTIEFTTSSGKIKLYAQVARLDFTLHSHALSLPAYQGLELRTREGLEKYLFVPFTDENSGAQAYGAGRYLDLQIPDGDTITIDFNYAYNPYCAYTSGYSCPIPKPESRLSVPINAGEQVYH